MNNKLKIIVKDIFRYAYNKLPMNIRTSSLYRKTYEETYNFLEESEYWSKEKMQKYQNEKLHDLILYAYNNVPYYKKLFDDLAIDPDSITDTESLKKVPYLTKDIIKEEGERMLSTAVHKNKRIRHETGGSSGKPISIWYEKDIVKAKEDAFVARIWGRIGYNDTDRIAIFRDINFIREMEMVDKNIVYKRMPGTNKFYFSFGNLRKETIQKYREAIIKIKPQWIIAYPASLYYLVQLLDVNMESPFDSLKGIIFMSETLYPHQIKVFKKFFNVKMLHAYGHTEKACLAGTCEESMRFHIQPEYGIAEFIENDGMMELVATGFINNCMPLIRYKTQDLFVLSSEKCSCGREHQLIESIEGRTGDRIYLSDGSIVTDTYCDFAISQSIWQSKVEQFQVRQDKVGFCEIWYIPLSDKEDIHKLEAEIKSDCENYLYNKIIVTPKKVDNIPRTIRGKQKLIVSAIGCDKESKTN
ncbi:MAG: phenylacetate--CoA ligase family protein [Lachnospiraceae bacterium]|nr:phenylacetate--CoA ligase family protein [Lachnospiraceae bacterium]MBP3595253.1 phenylacetate--CoA ligase family protein [Lachnospiraceae bacterium]